LVRLLKLIQYIDIIPLTVIGHLLKLWFAYQRDTDLQSRLQHLLRQQNQPYMVIQQSAVILQIMLVALGQIASCLKSAQFLTSTSFPDSFVPQTGANHIAAIVEVLKGS
jgi:hypothetical protein